jgi:hypothetical protein
MKLHDAIFQLNQTVVTIRDMDAFDANENPVAYDLAAAEALVAANEYKTKRAAEYPDFRDYLDGIVKGDQEQIAAYIAACQAVKTKYPKA